MNATRRMTWRPSMVQKLSTQFVLAGLGRHWWLFRTWALTAGLMVATPSPLFSANVTVNVHHKEPSRDGLYIEPAFTPAAAAGLKRDLGFNGSIVGHVYAQPLYIEGGPSGKAIIIVVTESDNVLCS